MLYLKPANFEDLYSEYEYVKEMPFDENGLTNEFLCEKLNITRNTASKYLHELTAAGLLIEEKIGKNKIFKNAFLYNLIKLW